MSTLYTAYSQHANTVITVTNNAELNAALAQMSSSGGGTILLDGNGGPFNINANGIGGANSPILIKASDPLNLPTVESINLQNSSHIAMTDLHVDSTVGGNAQSHDILVTNSTSIEIVGNTMTSDGDGFLDGTGSATRGADLAFVRSSTDVTFSNNYIADFCKGATFKDVNGFDFSNNEMVGIQFDGLHGVGWKDATVTNNYMHDFYGATQQMNHGDFIQIYSRGANLVTDNVQISGNILDTNGGAAYQGIFITSQTLGDPGAEGQYFNNVEVYDNLVHTGKWHGITVGTTTGAKIYDNTVLWDSASMSQASAGAPLTPGEPWIRVSNAPGAQVFDNVAGKIVEPSGNPGSQNYILSYSDPNSSAYYAKHIADLSGSGNSPIDDLSFLSISSLYGNMGSTYSTVGGPWDAGSTQQPLAPSSGGSSGGSTSTTPTTPPPDTSGDTSTDTGGDTSTDTSGDTSTDTSTDTGSDGSGSDTDTDLFGTIYDSADIPPASDTTYGGFDNKDVSKFLKVKTKEHGQKNHDEISQMRHDLNEMLGTMKMGDFAKLAAESDTTDPNTLGADLDSTYTGFENRDLNKLIKVSGKTHWNKHYQEIRAAKLEIKDMLKSVKVGDLLKLMQMPDTNASTPDDQDETDVLDYQMLF